MTFEIGNLRLSDTATAGLAGAAGINNAAKSALARSKMWKEGMKDVYDIYPMTDPSCSSESYKLFGDGYFLTNDAASSSHVCSSTRGYLAEGLEMIFSQFCTMRPYASVAAHTARSCANISFRSLNSAGLLNSSMKRVASL